MRDRLHVLLSVVALCFVCSINSALAFSWDPLIDAGANLIAWYEASDSNNVVTSGINVSNWKDMSGNGYDLNQVAGGNPDYDGSQINGLNVIHFSGTFDELYRSGIPDTNCTELCVISVGEPKQPGDYPNLGSVYSTDLSDKIFLRLQNSAASGKISSGVKVDGASVSLTSANSADIVDDVPVMLAVYYDGFDGVARVNGGAITQTANATDGATFTINEIQVGRDSGTPKNYYGEMIVLNTADIDTIEKAEGYLAHKWKMWSSLPPDHPYRYHEPNEPIPFGALSVSNITTTSAQLYVDAETNLTSATVVWDASDKGKTNVLDWAASNSSISGVGSAPGAINGAATGLTEDTWYYARFYGEDATTNGWSIPLQFATALTANQTPQFSAAYPSASRVYLYWSDNANSETAYVLQRATSSGGPYSDLVTLATDTTTYADQTVSAGTTYFYRLLATNSSSMTATDPSACQISTTTLTEGPWITLSTTAPTSNEADIAHLDLSNLNATGDKMWTDSPGYGQTFLTGSKGGKLKAVTHVNRTTYTVPTKRFSVRVGKMDGSTFNGIYWDSADQTNDTTAANMYWTFNFATPIDLEPNTLYGVDQQSDSSSGTGIPYWHRDNGDVYADGQRYQITRGYTTTVSLQNNDRIFHLDIEFPPPSGTLIMIR